ncbi:hypothetical protein BKA64DRAFT_158101 [Cadophora sp. MPI-SDFR-AT-0126]|nr:hypothetical protein BKA64DRAFT_158101 [Leotiomycetes sp. MPI-SDFR-AT-0126]
MPLGSRSSFSQSVVDSTDNGIMTPTIDDNHSETLTYHGPLPAVNFEARSELDIQPSFMKANTHNTVFTDSQVPTIETFAADLQSAIDGAWPVRSKPQYKAVHVLILSWEDGEPGLWADTQRLKYLFSSLYQYEVEEFKIPGASPGSLTSKLTRFIREKSSANNLLIIYDIGSVFPYLDSLVLEEATSDMLLLCDSCYSPTISSIYSRGTTEVLAACGRDRQSPSSGPHSFTNLLIRELEAAFPGPPLSVAELHGRLLNTMGNLKLGLMRNTHGNLMMDENGRPRYETLVKRTPVHAFLPDGMSKRSILLSPLPRRSATGANLGANLIREENDWDMWGSPNKSKYSRHTQHKTAPSALAVPAVSLGLETTYPRVLISVGLERNYFLDVDSDEDSVWTWAEWLRDIPSGLEPVVIEAIYRSSSSTLMIVSMPLLVWHMLPSNPAYSFVGFVNSANFQAVPSKAPPAVVICRDEGSVGSDSKEKMVDGHQAYVDVEKEIRNRVEAEMAAKELTALREEKKEWHQKLELEKEAAMARGMAMANPFSKTRREIGEIGRAKAPIKFKDAVGRKYSFPFHMAATWNGVEELIKQAFLHVDVLGPHVNEGHYDLICSSGDLSGQIILPQVWETMVEPGWEINMHMWPLPDPPKPIPPPPHRYPVPPKGPPPGPSVRAAPPPPPGYAVPWQGSASARRRDPPPPPPPPGHLHSPTPIASGQPLVNLPSAHPGVPIVKKSKSKGAMSSSVPGDTLPSITDSNSNNNEAIQEGGPSSRSRRSSSSRSDCGSEGEYSERDNAIALLKSMVSAKRIFVVGRVGTMGYGRRGLIDVKVKPKGKGIQLLNEYGRMFVEKVRMLEVEKQKVLGDKDEGKEVLVDD